MNPPLYNDSDAVRIAGTLPELLRFRDRVGKHRREATPLSYLQTSEGCAIFAVVSHDCQLHLY